MNKQNLTDGVFPKGRVCGSKRCTTILSIYNPGPHCHIHAERMNAAEREQFRRELMRDLALAA